MTTGICNPNAEGEVFALSSRLTSEYFTLAEVLTTINKKSHQGSEGTKKRFLNKITVTFSDCSISIHLKIKIQNLFSQTEHFPLPPKKNGAILILFK